MVFHYTDIPYFIYPFNSPQTFEYFHFWNIIHNVAINIHMHVISLVTLRKYLEMGGRGHMQSLV